MQLQREIISCIKKRTPGKQNTKEKLLRTATGVRDEPCFTLQSQKPL